MFTNQFMSKPNDKIKTPQSLNPMRKKVKNRRIKLNTSN